MVRKVKLETGIEEDLTKTIISSLKGADHLGTLLKINTQIDELISKEAKNLRQTVEEQPVLLGDQPVAEKPLSPKKAKQLLLKRLTKFLQNHTRGDDLGLQMRGRQLTAGLRFWKSTKKIPMIWSLEILPIKVLEK